MSLYFTKTAASPLLFTSFSTAFCITARRWKIAA